MSIETTAQKIEAVINSCKTKEQLKVAVKMFDKFMVIHKDDLLFKSLYYKLDRQIGRKFSKLGLK